MAEAAIQLASEQGFAYFLAAAAILRGWATAASGEAATGLKQMQEALATYRATGAELHMPYLLTMVADGHRRMRQFDLGLSVVEEALSRIQHKGERWLEAELYRLQGEYRWQQGGHAVAKAEEDLRQAIDLARQRGTKALELRASVSLGRLWQSQGKLSETQRMIETLRQELTEGEETPDLQEAKQLHDECAADEKRAHNAKDKNAS